MNAEILAVGTELLLGQIVNTNAQYISARLPDVGVNVYYHSVVGDNPVRLKECFNTALKRSDVIILTGGLGPTRDDLTKETVAEILNRKLVLHEETLEMMKQFFARFNRKMTENNIKQAYIPENSIIIQNDSGTAPGCIIEEGDKIVILLPGPPSEMKPMFESTVIPYFEKTLEFRLESRYVRIFGLGESVVEEKIIDLIDSQTNPTIAPYAREGEVTVRITAKYKKEDTTKDIITPVISEIKKRLGNAIFSTENKNLEEVVGELLINNNITLSVAESCTGGLVCKKLTDIPGISKVFNRGIISYSNGSKIEELGVDPQVLEKYGAVSRETAVEMAVGMRKISKTDIALAITGIAGPDGGTAEKPVGLVFIAIADKDEVKCKELRLWGTRSRVRNVTSLHAFDMIRRKILNFGI
jgi:nicotinamide-nucleotide amidase